MTKPARPPRKRPGARPRAGVAASVRVELRLTPAEHARWQARANAKGVTISEFVRGAVELSP